MNQKLGVTYTVNNFYEIGGRPPWKEIACVQKTGREGNLHEDSKPQSLSHFVRWVGSSSSRKDFWESGWCRGWHWKPTFAWQSCVRQTLKTPRQTMHCGIPYGLSNRKITSCSPKYDSGGNSAKEELGERFCCAGIGNLPMANLASNFCNIKPNSVVT